MFSPFSGPFVINESLSFDPSQLLNFGTVRDYFLHGRGPLSSTFAVDFMGFINSKNNLATDNPGNKFYEKWLVVKQRPLGQPLFSMAGQCFVNETEVFKNERKSPLTNGKNTIDF